MKYVNEATAITVRARFFNNQNDLSSPNSVRYSIRDLTNDRLVRDWTSLASAPTIDIEISASDNLVFNNSRRPKKFEHRVVTVQVNVGEDAQKTEEIEYWLRDLAGVVN